MNDTSPAAAALMHRLLMQRTPEERLLMGFSMNEFARSLVEASLRAEGLVDGTFEFRRRYLQRMYGDELRPAVIDEIARHCASDREQP